ncbi:MAG: hypothetical protein OEW00_09515, partial [candidate division Zixibacteria bacterium]|nr:hypothetical protein [candidate division Zixibacteria bacterium]
YKNQVRQVAQESKEYQVVRSQVARGLNRAIHMAQKLGVPIDMTSVPPPAGGGHIVEFDMFSAVLHDPSHGGIERQLIVDALNRTEGECETAVKQQFRRLINPFYWLLELLSFVLRIPFLIVSSTGFDVSKIEDQFFGKSLKLVLAALILYLLIKLGFTKEELLEWLSRIW